MRIHMSASLFSSLANELRLKITMDLSYGEKSVSDLAKSLHLPQATVSKGLKVLMASGVVRMRKQGVVHFYNLTDGVGRQAVGLVEWYRQTAGTTEVRMAQLRRDRQFESLMDINPCPVIVSKIPDGTIIYANPSALNFFKGRNEQLVGQDIMKFVHLRDHRLMKVNLKKLFDGELMPSVRRTMIRTDGTSVKAEVAAAPTFIFDHNVMVSLILPLEGLNAKL
jgi:PAS domain S-box-containing protein